MGASPIFHSQILGTGAYLPEKVLTNFDLEKMVDTSDSWIVERTGIRTRHLAAENQATSDLAYIAAQRALAAAQVSADELDLIIVGTVTPDQEMPSAACELQAKLRSPRVLAFDLKAACSGFLYGMTVADAFIRSGSARRALVVGAEVLQRVVNYKDRETCILFGDGAGAVIVGARDSLLGGGEGSAKSEVLACYAVADGEAGPLLSLPAGGSRIPTSRESIEKNLHFVHMKGRELFKHAVRAMCVGCESVLDQAKMSVEQVDWVIPHQANIRIIDAVVKHFNIPEKRVVINVDRTGNTSAATIPIALDEAVRDGRIQRGQLVLMTAFGGGLTSGSILLRY